MAESIISFDDFVVTVSEDSEESIGCKIIKEHIPILVKKILPDDICDQLISKDLISEAVYTAMYDRSVLREDRAREMITAILQSIKKDESKFEMFCSVLEKAKKPSICKLGIDMLEEFKSKLEEPMKPVLLTSQSLTDLKFDLEFFNRQLAQSDENLDEKYTLIKEGISRFIHSSLESGNTYESIQESLNSLCTVEMLIPSKLQEWCFDKLDKLSNKGSSSNVESSLATLNRDASLAVPELFSKDNIYHAILLCTVLFHYDSKNCLSFFRKNKHSFDEISMSIQDAEYNKNLEEYIIARKKNTLFVAFNGEPFLSSWQEKYSSLEEGILIQMKRIPIRFFVDYLQRKDGEQVTQCIFTGFSFGASLAMAVYAELWNQSCLEIDDLQTNVACFVFGAPVFNISCVEKIFDEEKASNTHLFYTDDDVFPRVIQCVDFPKPDSADVPSRSVSKFYADTACGDILKLLSELQDIHYQKRRQATANTSKLMESLRMTLKAMIPKTQSKISVPGLVYNVHRIHPQDSTYNISGPSPNPDHLLFPNTSVIDSLQADIFKKHSIQRYHSLLTSSRYFESEEFGGKYTLPPTSNTPKQFKLKPNVTKAEFFRHDDEVAIVLEGINLWFCHKIKIGTRQDARYIEFDAEGQDTTMRSINFNYKPKEENDLLIKHKSSKVNITLYSHFCKANVLRDIEAIKMENYEISFRQRQLASLTPSEVIRLSLLSAILERSSIKSQSTGRPSKRFQIICQFLEDATKIVPVESICHAIENESARNSWKCAEVLIDSGFKPRPSLLFEASLAAAYLRLTTGIKPSELQRAQEYVVKAVRGGWPFSPIRTNIEVSEDEVIVTAEKGRTRPVLRRSPRGTLEYDEEVVFDNTPTLPIFPRSFSDVVREKKHSVSIPKPEESKQEIFGYSKQAKILHHLQRMSESVSEEFLKRKSTADIICGLNISKLYPIDGQHGIKKSSSLKSPIDFLKEIKGELAELQQKAMNESSDNILDDKDGTMEHHNERMIEIINSLMSEELAICLSLLGAFMERQMKVPFVNSLPETAHVLQTIQSSSAIGVWTLFSLKMMDMESLIRSNNGKLVIEVEKYIHGILRESDNDSSPAYDRYAGKLQFLMVSMGKTVSCNSQYISYSLERQLSKLCNEYDIKPDTRVDSIVEEWNEKFRESILCHVLVGFRPLLARWLIWSLNIHKLREELASHTTVGIVGLSKSGKSCLVKNLFDQKAISGTTQIQRTTVPFLYNLEGVVDGLSIVDFPGVDDKDKNVINLSKILLQLSQITILVVDYRRISTQAAMDWIKQLDKGGVPVLLCLTHADKLYADKCLKIRQDYPDEDAKRSIGKEFENIKKLFSSCPTRKVILCSFDQDADSHLNNDAGRETLSKIGIQSQKNVGQWLIETLKHQKQNVIADKLFKYFNREVAEESVDIDLAQDLSISQSPLKDMPRVLSGVEVYAEMAWDVYAPDGPEYSFLNWEGYGIKVSIPPGAMKKGIKYTIAMKAVNVKDLVLNPDMEVVSAFYWVFSSQKFLEPVDLQIEHCAKLMDKSDISRMGIITARCDEGLPGHSFYKMRSNRTVFELQSRQASISTCYFSYFAAVRDWLFPPRTNETCYVYLVFGKKTERQNIWHYDLYFLKDDRTLIKKIKNECAVEGWIEDTPPTHFDFAQNNANIIDIVLPTSNLNDWKILLKSKRKIKKAEIDRTLENTTPHRCRVVFHWRGEGPPNSIDYSVDINGINCNSDLPPKIELIVPFGSSSDSDQLLVNNNQPPSAVAPTLPSQVYVQIHNNPEFNVAPSTNIINRCS